MIVFGHNNFLLHGCKPSELGLPVELDEKYRVERRQRYAHLFWIPTFGIGKVWVLRDIKSEQLYEPNAIILQMLNALPLKDKTPWYTFSLPLLALAAAIIVPIYMKIEDYASEKRYAAYQAEQHAAMKAAIESPGKNQYFELRDNDYKKSFIKVVGSDENFLKCLVVNGDYNDSEFLEEFAKNTGELDTVSIDKSKLIQSIEDSNVSGSGIAALPDGRPRTISEKYTFDGPVFHTVLAGFEDGKYVATLWNVGANVVLDSIHIENSNLKLDSLPTHIKYGDVLNFKGTYDGMEPQYNAVWYFKNSDGATSKYDVRIYSARVYFNKK